MARDGSLDEKLFELLTDNPDDASGLTARANDREPANFVRNVGNLAATKLADGLLDPKLVLSWLLTHLGAGSFWTGLLVPVREAGALLPQLLTSAMTHGLERRKWVCAAGSLGQGVAALIIVVAGLTCTGSTAGVVIVAALALLALSRSVSSVTVKDIMGKTIGAHHRGSASGFAAMVASGGVIVFALILLTGVFDRFTIVIGAVCAAAALWVVSAAVLTLIAEERDTHRTPKPASWAAGQLSILTTESDLTRFIVSRSLLVGSALAPPYLVMMASKDGVAVESLGLLVLASAGASFVSSYVWGRLADRSSRLVLVFAGIAGAAALGLALAADALSMATAPAVIPVVLFLLMVAYHGVRIARSTYLIDMAGPDDRAAFTAVSNTVVGIWLLVAGAGAAGLAAISVPLAVGTFAVMSAAGGAVAWTMVEAEERVGNS